MHYCIGIKVPQRIFSEMECSSTGCMSLLAACKQGFLASYRPMICVHACLLKGKRGAQLHAVVARDATDDISPIAYAICESKTRDTWTWFLKTLLDDIGYPRDHMWSFMSDHQKVIFNVLSCALTKFTKKYFNMSLHNIIKQGLIQALEELMPGLEHRYCVKHLHANRHVLIM
jgi:hypothetical protein